MKLGTNYLHLLIEDKHVDCWGRTWPIKTSWNLSLSLFCLWLYIYIYTVHVTNITAQIWVDMEIKQESLEGI